ncbi:MAG TPA: hypothetical protein VII36_08095, partial [Usitatibacter sp.]
MMMHTEAIRLDRRAACRFLAGAALAAAALGASAELTFMKSSVKVGPHPLHVEIAASDPQRMQGLMYRKKLGHNDGM